MTAEEFLWLAFWFMVAAAAFCVVMATIEFVRGFRGK